jgi:hypothetical protein
MKPEVAAWISILAKRLRIPLFRECDPLIREACEQGGWIASPSCCF